MTHKPPNCSLIPAATANCNGVAAEHAHPADRFAREIRAILERDTTRSRRLMRNSLDRAHYPIARISLNIDQILRETAIMDNDTLLEKITYITLLAQRMVESRNGPTPHVWVLWYRNIDTDRLIHDLAQTLAALVEQHLAIIASDSCTLHREELRSSPLGDFVASVTITRISHSPGQWIAGFCVPSIQLPRTSPEIASPKHTIISPDASLPDIATDQKMKQMVILDRMFTFLSVAQLSVLNDHIISMRRSGHNRMVTTELLAMFNELVPAERREEAQIVLAAMQRDADYLSYQAFLDKWALSGDAT